MNLAEAESILVTGGSGSFGKAFIESLLKSDETKDTRIVIFSRDELKQWELQSEFPINKYPNLRFFIGDIRDKDRLKRALQGIDIVVHAAALKQVPAAEYNPMEFIKTNVIGSNNLVDTCIDTGVKKVVALSTDKAAAPINLYGATKLCADKLFIAANNIRGNSNITFSVVRYGNVMGSRGSVIPYFLKSAKEGELKVTDNKMTRFNITLSEGVDMVKWAINNGIGGEIFVPKIPSYRIIDVAKAIGPNCIIENIGIRPGEKLHEEMITSSDSYSTKDLGDYFAILPNPIPPVIHEHYKQHPSVGEGFAYSSGSNESFLSIEEIRKLITEHIDESFTPV